MDVNGFENYTINVPRTPNIETEEPEIKMIDERYKYNNNNINTPLKQFDRVSEWFTDEDTICTNASTNFLNVDEGNLYTKGNGCDVTYITVTDITFDIELTPLKHVLLASKIR